MTVMFDDQPTAIGEFIVGGRAPIATTAKPPDYDETILWFFLIGGLFASGGWHCWISF